MRLKGLIIACVLFALAISAACADTVYMKTADLAANGWSAITKNSVSDPRATVQDKLNYGGANGIQFSPGRSGSNDWSWAGIGTSLFDGKTLASITSLKIRVYGAEGDGSVWQCPSFHFILAKAPGNLSNRFLTWVPWDDGTPRAPGQWNTYDAMTDGKWIVSWTGASYTTLAAAQAAIPLGYFANASEIATMYSSHPSNKAFNVMSGSWINNETQYFSSARGTVDWFEVGFNGVSTTYDLGDAAPAVPEPGSIVALATGLVGLVGLRRRVK